MTVWEAVFGRKKKQGGGHRSFAVDSACICHMGFVRGNNEDNFYYCGRYEKAEHFSMEKPYAARAGTENRQVFAVFDGMGGEQAGEAASYAAASAVLEKMPKRLSGPSLSELIWALNRRVCEAAEEKRVGQIGTTATILAFQDDEAYLANVGDSPAFLLRDGTMRMISEQHTDEALLRRYQVSDRKPRLTQFLGVSEQELLLEPFVTRMKVKEGDLFLLCSDGLTDLLSKDEVCGILEKSSSMSGAASHLCSEALQKGGTDNITAIVCKVSSSGTMKAGRRMTER